jgi:rhomboid protease GluP
MKVNELIVQGEYWRLITPMFLHGGLLHIGFNMYFLYNIGPGLENRFGRGRFLLLYFLAGFAGNVASMIMTPNPSLGASTAIFGLIGAQGIFIFLNRDWFPDRGSSALRSIITVLAINLVFGLTAGIDNWGHIGGLLGGTLFTFLAGPLLRAQAGALGQPTAVQDERPVANIFLAAVVVGGGFGLLGLYAIIAGWV